jgi:hypothetical protein
VSIRLKPEGEGVWQEWAQSSGRRHPFIVTRASAFKLVSHLEKYPDADIILISHLHDFPRQLFAEGLLHQATLWVTAPSMLLMMKEAYPELSLNVQLIGWTTLCGNAPPPVDVQTVRNILVIAENHPYGGLALSAHVIEELRRAGWEGKAWERTVPIHGTKVPVRDWSIHHFPKDWLHYSLAWRKKVDVVQVVESIPDDTAVLWLPHHLAAPLSANPAWCAQLGLPLCAFNDPWVDDFSFTTPPTLIPRAWLADYDPFRLPGESPVNAGIARAIARQFLERGFFQ